jgi:hypothetical protein
VAKIPYDLAGVDAGGAELPPVGIYKAKVSKLTDETPDGKARRLVVVVDLTDPRYKGFRLWKYISLPFDKKSPSAWIQAQFLAATTGKEKGSIDPDRPGDLNEFKVDLRHREWDGEMRGELKSFIPLSDDDDEGEDEDENENGEEDITLEELQGYTSKQLLAFLDENELEPPDDLPRAASAKKAALLEYIEEELFADGVEDTEPEEEDEDEEPEEDEEPDLEAMSLAELKVYAQENSITLPAGLKGRTGKAAAIAAIEEAAEAEDDGEDEDGDDYDEWSLAELKKELADRSLKIKGRATEAKIIAALRADDAEENPV